MSRLSPGDRGRALRLKWPNDLLLDGAKLSGILLERADDAVVIGFGVNLAHHPTARSRRHQPCRARRRAVDPADVRRNAGRRASRAGSARWRGEGLAPVRARWLERAHPAGTALTARLPDGTALDGLFDGLDADGALILRLADGDQPCHSRRRRLPDLKGRAHMLLAIDAGNTNVVFALVDDGEIKRALAHRHRSAPHRRRICGVAQPVAAARRL